MVVGRSKLHDAFRFMYQGRIEINRSCLVEVLFDLTQGERGAIGQRTCEGKGFDLQQIVSDHPVEQADALSTRRVDTIRGEHKLSSDGRTNRTCQ